MFVRGKCQQIPPSGRAAVSGIVPTQRFVELGSTRRAGKPPLHGQFVACRVWRLPLYGRIFSLMITLQAMISPPTHSSIIVVIFLAALASPQDRHTVRSMVINEYV